MRSLPCLIFLQSPALHAALLTHHCALHAAARGGAATRWRRSLRRAAARGDGISGRMRCGQRHPARGRGGVGETRLANGYRCASAFGALIAPRRGLLSVSGVKASINKMALRKRSEKRGGAACTDWTAFAGDGEYPAGGGKTGVADIFGARCCSKRCGAGASGAFH